MRLTFRRLTLAPSFTVIALLTLAIGIGANTAIFSVVNGVLIKPLPYPDSESLIVIRHSLRGADSVVRTLDFTPSMYFTYHDEARTFQDFGIWTNRTLSITGVGEPERVQGLGVTHGLLAALRVRPVLGRSFLQIDDTPGNPETVILTYGYWQRRFGGDRSVIGRSLAVDSRPREVIGVMPENFRFLNSDWQVILPLPLDRSRQGLLDDFSYQGIARLKPGTTVEQAKTDMRRMIAIWLRSWNAAPGLISRMENSGIGPVLPPLKQDVVGDVSRVLWVLMGTIGMVLLIACANVANLLLVRAEGRQQEFAIRAALGAGWVRISRELLAESILLGAMGGALGLGLAYAGLKLLASTGPATLPRLGEVGMDPLVLSFAVGASLLSGLLFGFIPVLKYAGPHIAMSLRAGGRSASPSRERHRARNVLVVSQVALALVLLVSAGLMIRTFQALRSVQPGFAHPEQLQMVRISIPQDQVSGNAWAEQVFATQKEMLDKIAAIPGVSSAAYVTSPPMEPYSPSTVFYDADKVYGEGEIGAIYRLNYITPRALATFGTTLAAGRDFTWIDVSDHRPVAMVSANLARERWGNPVAALGKRIRRGREGPAREIVGVVEDVHSSGVEKAAPTTVYWPARAESTILQGIWSSVTFAIRSDRAGTEGLLSEVRRAIWDINPNLPLFDVRTLKETYNASMARTSFTLVMLAIAGGMAMMLGVIGIYGVISYAVTQRTREIGIRVALGAQRAEVEGMFVRYALVLAGIGVVIGLGAAAGLARVIKSLLFEISPLDPVTYAIVPLVLMAAAGFASYLPARRAAAVDPVDALRAD